MNAIMVVFAQGAEVRISLGQVAGTPTVDSLQQCGQSSVREETHTLKAASQDELTPPFWTWFIENPRGRGAI